MNQIHSPTSSDIYSIIRVRWHFTVIALVSCYWIVQSVKAGFGSWHDFLCLFAYFLSSTIRIIWFLFLQSVFTLLLGPFTFFNAQKTKYLQILTSLMRWIGENKLILHCFLFLTWFLFPASSFSTYIHFHFLCFFSLPPSSYLRLCGCRLCSGPSIMVRSCSVSLIPISSHSSAWQAWQPVPSLIGPSLTGRRAKINRPSWGLRC